jgi:flagellar basal-body rod protein FlgB
MAGLSLTDSATSALVSALDGLSVRQRVIGNNLANIDTPGFKSSDVSFARHLNNAVQAGSQLSLTETDGNHLQAENTGDGVDIITRTDTTHRLDGNNVDIDKEMEYLSETTIHYQAASRMVTRRLAGIRSVINDGRR